MKNYLKKLLLFTRNVIVICFLIVLFGYFCKGVHTLFMIGWNG
jgi:hypothetical protein